MDFEQFWNEGGGIVKNPNYNPKSKKNTEPPTLVIPDLGAMEQTLEYNTLGYNLNDYGDYNKLGERGIQVNRFENFDKELSKSQSAFSKWTNAIGQTLVSEIGLGTAEGFSDLIDSAKPFSGVKGFLPKVSFLTTKLNCFQLFTTISHISRC